MEIKDSTAAATPNPSPGALLDPIKQQIVAEGRMDLAEEEKGGNSGGKWKSQAAAGDRGSAPFPLESSDPRAGQGGDRQVTARNTQRTTPFMLLSCFPPLGMPVLGNVPHICFSSSIQGRRGSTSRSDSKPTPRSPSLSKPGSGEEGDPHPSCLDRVGCQGKSCQDLGSSTEKLLKALWGWERSRNSQEAQP